ncbi:unnamed protein product [Strongylus vulgaris]|uniref:Peptidase M12A domain-containing protein n=1 Tax=Strongylus vulgaris TaxID=40348 RepID=A0A3P7JXW4_STRVU|nr:unnamed protein product [Strongylus vulgaris]
MAEFPKHTCITFRPRTPSDQYYLAINKYYDLERCFSYIGRQTASMFQTADGKTETRMKLDPSCLRFNGRGTVMHELMHILGFYHEHQRLVQFVFSCSQMYVSVLYVICIVCSAQFNVAV